MYNNKHHTIQQSLILYSMTSMQLCCLQHPHDIATSEHRRSGKENKTLNREHEHPVSVNPEKASRLEAASLLTKQKKDTNFHCADQIHFSCILAVSHEKLLSRKAPTI